MVKLTQPLTPAMSRMIWQNPVHFIACGFGVGCLPVMPGTYGTVLGVLFYWVLQPYGWPLYVAVASLLFLVGIFLCATANQAFKTQDHPAAVWDEVVGFLFVMVGVPHQVAYVLLGFALFRFFDIVKPGPIGWIDRHVHGGWGVMLDDLAAALVSCAVLQLVVWLVGAFH